MKKLITAIVILLMAAVSHPIKAQVDPHFSQYYADPLWLNPALTGVINGDYRVNLNYKNQWPELGNAYQTGALSIDGKASPNVSLGLNILTQRSGDAGFNYTSAYASFGYNITLSNDGNQKLNFGLQAGLLMRGFDPSKLQLGSQYDPETGFNPGASTGETYQRTNSGVFDANVGIFYYNGDPLSKANLFAGVSVAHINRPNDAFAIEGPNSKLPMRYAAQLGVKLRASEFFSLTPHLLYIKQKDNDIQAVGAYSELKVHDDQGFILGGMYRMKDAAVANVGYHVNNYIFGFSYDFNTSSLRPATSGHGGFELSISYVFRTSVSEPEPICPRL